MAKGFASEAIDWQGPKRAGGIIERMKLRRYAPCIEAKEPMMHLPHVKAGANILMAFRSRRLIALALLFAAGASPVVADDTATCNAVIATATQSNGFKLFEGATACAKAERQADVNYLIIAGQIRSVTDMMILTPDDAGVDRAGALYSQIYYQFGGLGLEAVYRNPADADALEARLRAFAPTYAEGYDPGWSFRASAKTDIYDAVLVAQRDGRIWEMLNYALRLQNDDYFAVQQEMNQLQRDNPTFQEGTSAYKKYVELTTKLAEIGKAIPQLPPPTVDTSFVARLNEPDAELAQLQVASGFNGPARGQKFEIWRSEAEVRASWLPGALTAEELTALLTRTDFSVHSLVGYSFGAFDRASGDIQFSQLRYDRRLPGYSVSVNVGVVPEECGVESATSYPFAVGLIEAVPGAEIMGSGYSNFASPCHAVVSAEPTPLP
jgi:hypothetical protein